jgi:hypothetical protein
VVGRPNFGLIIIVSGIDKVVNRLFDCKILSREKTVHLTVAPSVFEMLGLGTRKIVHTIVTAHKEEIITLCWVCDRKQCAQSR